MNPEDLRRALTEEEIPVHRTGFWDDLGEQIGDRSDGLRRRSGWMVALQSAAAVIVVVGVAALLIRDNPTEALPAATLSQTTLTETSAPEATPSAPSPVATAGVDDSVPETGDTAPWDRAPLDLAGIPSVLIDEWQRAENQLWCSVLFPLTVAPEGATMRRAEFGGGWAVAWDLPELRSAFGVAGVGLPAWDDIGTRMPMTVRYGDQVVGYGGEGFDDDAEQRLAEFSIPGQLCAYQVWSKLGDEHLLGLVDSLRQIDGLQAEPFQQADTEPAELGPAPWSGAVVAYPESWPVTPTETLAFIPTVGIPEGAQVRTTTQPTWSLAWDASSGPGHDATNYPCRDCGRGVIGITVSSYSVVPDGAPDARWDDGSVGFILPRVGDPGIPIDRLLFRAPGSDDLVPGSPRIDIYIPELSVVVSVWSHLGTDSLFELVDGLRLADPGL
jgi:hypothetical protein